MEHTPGPWCLHPNNKVDIISGKDRFLVAHVGKDARDPSEYEANARLIASAPEMLKILQTIVGLPGFEPTEQYGKDILAVLAHAEGGRK